MNYNIKWSTNEKPLSLHTLKFDEVLKPLPQIKLKNNKNVPKDYQ